MMTSARYGASRLSTNFSHSCMPIKKVGLMQGKSCIKPRSGLRDCPFLRPAPWLAPKGLQHHTHRRHRSCSTRTTATLVAEPAVLEVKAFSGEATGSARLSLKVADPYTAGGLVHRNVVTIRQNARRVSGQPAAGHNRTWVLLSNLCGGAGIMVAAGYSKHPDPV